MKSFVRLVPLLLATGAFAQQQELPKELPKDLHGRWTAATAAGRTAPLPFDLESVKLKDGGTFAARLSWTTADARCTIRTRSDQAVSCASCR